jgi:hypothetical protein
MGYANGDGGEYDANQFIEGLGDSYNGLEELRSARAELDSFVEEAVNEKESELRDHLHTFKSGLREAVIHKLDELIERVIEDEAEDAEVS